MAITRVKLDGTAAGLLQLLQDNTGSMAVLTTTDNKYSGPPMTDPDNDIASYPEVFKDVTKDGFYSPPSATIMTAARGKGFNLGQVFGGSTSVITDLEDRGIAIVDDWFDRLIEEADVGMAAFFTAMKVTVGSSQKIAERVSQLYRPGFSRVMQPTLTSIPFDELINQNLLLPPNESGAPLSTGGTPAQSVSNTTEADMNATYQNLWSRNRATGTAATPRGLTDTNRFKRGTIAGTGINDIQEPLEDISGNVPIISKGSGDGFSDLVNKTSVPFTFKDDDEQYLTYKQRRAGFTQNLYTTKTSPEGMAPAVVDIPGYSAADAEGTSAFRREGRRSVLMGDGQYFPFTFSTVNKKGGRTQLCTLQATIQSLGESYAPTWQSKHFFGRSEQIHTYTFTDRTIDISFVVHADEMRKLQNVYERVLWLAQQCYPDYSDDNRLGSGPIIAMRVGDLIQHKAGFIRSLSYDWSFLGPGGKWELTKGIRMPQGCNVTMSYQVIHENVPSRNSNFYGGPGGGLAAGVGNFRTIDYANPDYDDESVRTGIPADFSNEGRYIPQPPVIPGIGEQNYLDSVNTAYVEDRADAVALDIAILPTAAAEDSETGERSLVYG